MSSVSLYEEVVEEEAVVVAAVGSCSVRASESDCEGRGDGN